jgi:hypothetical protein
MLRAEPKVDGPLLRPRDAGNWIIRKTAVDPQRDRQVRDLPGVLTAAQFTQWVTTAIAANLWLKKETILAASQLPFLGLYSWAF